MKHALLVRILLSACLAILGGSAGNAADDSQVWANSVVTVKLSKWRLSEDITARFSDHRSGLYEIESNTLVGYNAARGITFWAGYTHDPNYVGGHFAVMEERAREQVTFDNLASVGAGKLSARIRTEQRWRDGVAGTGWRVRPFAKYSLPLRKGARTALVISTEPFLDLNRTPFQRTRGLDRIRTFIGLSTPVARNVTADVGYLNQHTFVRNGRDNDDHIASISMSATL